MKVELMILFCCLAAVKVIVECQGIEGEGQFDPLFYGEYLLYIY